MALAFHDGRQRVVDCTRQLAQLADVVVVTVLEMVPGRGLFEFTIRPGARMGLLTSAHGLVSLAYGAPELLDAELARESAGSASKTAERIRKAIMASTRE